MTQQFKIQTHVPESSVVVSTIKRQSSDGTDFETMVFACDSNGKIIDWHGLECFRFDNEGSAVINHERVVKQWSNQHGH